jgi:hypothetical protein
MMTADALLAVLPVPAGVAAEDISAVLMAVIPKMSPTTPRTAITRLANAFMVGILRDSVHRHGKPTSRLG